jgi:hypothetical protein
MIRSRAWKWRETMLMLQRAPSDLSIREFIPTLN